MSKRKPESQGHTPKANVLEEYAPKRDPWRHFGKVLGVEIYGNGEEAKMKRPTLIPLGSTE